MGRPGVLFGAVITMFTSCGVFAGTPVFIVSPPIVTNINPVGEHDLILASRPEAREIFQNNSHARYLNLTLVPGIDHYPSDAELATVLLDFNDRNVILLIDHKRVLVGLDIVAMSDDQYTADLVRCTYLNRIHSKLSSETCVPLRR